MTPAQCRAARALLEWTQLDLSNAATVAVATVADFERGARSPHNRSLEAIHSALQRVGIVFLPGGATLAKEDPEPEWIVNDMGELGVMVNGRAFFLYKGQSIEYLEPHDDTGQPVLYRHVAKREFGEVQYPDEWLRCGRSENRYTQECTYTPGLSAGPENDPRYKWKPLPLTLPTEESTAPKE